MLGIIGGTGLYNIEGLSDIESRFVETPFGTPSAPITIGKMAGNKIAFLPRHGSGHSILPSEINFRANIYALKSIGVRRIISVSAVGSLKLEIKPGDLSIPHQYFDWTKGKRAGTFFGEGIVAHVSTAEPACSSLKEKVLKNAVAKNIGIHINKTYACVEGPRLGTRAESLFLQSAGCDLVGMTNVPEVFLAKEAQLCYNTIAVATDYDCWLDDPGQHASVDKVIELYKKNIGKVQELISSVISDSSEFESCQCHQSLKYALMTAESQFSAEQKRILAVLKE